MSTYWKTFAGHRIYHTPDLAVFQNPYYRWLIFQDQHHLQTLLHRKHPHKPALSYLQPFTLALRTHPGPACVLGLGGAAVAHMAGPYLQTVVEVNAEVIAVANSYFMLQSLPHLNIVHQDAQSFVAHCTEQYQHLLIDIYSASGFPPSCTGLDFFIQCKRLLQPDGILALNLVNIGQEFGIFKHIRTVFGQSTLCIPVPATANMIVFACKSKSPLMTLIQAYPSLKTLIWDGVFGLMAKI